jgi:ABC-type antimicrobial peptide transport system permease subunit
MIFGNAAIIATLSSNDGAKVYVANQLASLGNKLITVTIDQQSATASDLKLLNDYADEIEFATSEKVLVGAQAMSGVRTATLDVYSIQPEYFRAMNLSLRSGRTILRGEVENGSLVAMLGYHAHDLLFKERAGINENIILSVGGESVILRVIGTFSEKGGTAGSSLDRAVFISGNLANKIGSFENEKIMATLKSDARSEYAKNQIVALWSPIFGSAMRVVDAREAISRTRAIWNKQNFVGICLAGISMLTGGVGIMNIMLLSIYQRRKEIGIRKAVGARNSQIAAQFLAETVIICLCGSLLGIVVGWGFGQKVASMLGDWQATMSPSTVILALAFSVLTGVIFGAAPAARAAKIDPYEALRTG